MMKTGNVLSFSEQVAGRCKMTTVVTNGMAFAGAKAQGWHAGCCELPP